MRLRFAHFIGIVAAFMFASKLPGQRPDSVRAVGADSVTIRLVDADIRTALQLVAPFLDRPVVFGTLPAARVSLETANAVPKTQLLSLLRTLLSSQGLELQTDPSSYLVRTSPASTPPASDSASRGAGGPQLFVIHVRHARAIDVAAAVSALYGHASALLEPGARPASLSDQLRANLVPEAGAPRPEAVPAISGRAAVLAGDVTIIPDVKGNALLVRASSADFDLIAAAVKELDVRPMQVLIEVVIAEVRRDRSIGFGVDAALPNQALKGSGTRIEASTSGAGLGDFVLKLMSVGGVDLDMTLRAAASRGDVKILSRPVLLAANNEPAEILVGSQRPFVQVSRTLPTDSPLRDQIVQYKDVGTRLNILPTISDDGYVMLEVSQEVNAATTETQFDAPVISTRSVQTRLMVRDSQTVAIGGLNDRQRDESTGGIPLLSSIPILGGLFGHQSFRTTETELFIFLTPRVIRSDEDADRMSQSMRNRAEKLKP